MDEQKFKSILSDKANKLSVPAREDLWNRVERKLENAVTDAPKVKRIWRVRAVAASIALVIGASLAIMYNIGYQKGAKEVVWKELDIDHPHALSPFYTEVMEYHKAHKDLYAFNSQPSQNPVATIQNESPSHQNTGALNSNPTMEMASREQSNLNLSPEKTHTIPTTSSKRNTATPVRRNTSTPDSTPKEIASDISQYFGTYKESDEDQFMKNDKMPWILQESPTADLTIIHRGYIEDFVILERSSPARLISFADNSKTIVLQKQGEVLSLAYVVAGESGPEYTLYPIK